MNSIPDTATQCSDTANAPCELPSHANDYWRPTNRRHPCPVCGHRGYCEMSVNGRWRHCMFTASDLPWSKRQGGYLHRATDDDALDPAHDEATQSAATEPAAPCADSATLNAAYRLLHNLWPLTDADLALLTGPAHGLSAQQARALCATVPDDTLGLRRALNALIDRFGVTATLTIPGFYLADNGHLAFTGADLLFFRSDVHECITGAQIRLRHPREGQQKYVYLSSTRYGGPTPGSAPHVARRRNVARHGEVWITEGIKKATIAADALGVPVVGLLGVGTWRQAITVVRDLDATTVVIALDQDITPRATEMVERCRRGLAQALTKAGYIVKVATWPADIAKGLDDLLLIGETPDVVPYRSLSRVTVPRRVPGIPLPLTIRRVGVPLPHAARVAGVRL